MVEWREVSPGDIVASGRVGREDREYTYVPLRARPTHTEFAGFPGSVESEWTVIGYELCSRLVGSRAWRSEAKPKVSSMREALVALAQDLTLSDHVLIHPTAIAMRNEIRDREAREAGEEGEAEGEQQPETEGEGQPDPDGKADGEGEKAES